MLLQCYHRVFSVSSNKHKVMNNYVGEFDHQHEVFEDSGFLCGIIWLNFMNKNAVLVKTFITPHQTEHL